MQINFLQELKTLDGKSIPMGDRKMITLKDISLDALQTIFDDERTLSGEDKVKRWALATRIYANPEKIDLQSEETALIKKLIAKSFGPLIVGQAWSMLDPKTE
jgi:hypothetical protein